jgi:hypothetical protein
MCTPSLTHVYVLLTGCKNKHIAPVLRDIIQTEYFRVVVVDDVDTVEVCGALKVILRVKNLSVWFVGNLTTVSTIEVIELEMIWKRSWPDRGTSPVVHGLLYFFRSVCNPAERPLSSLNLCAHPSVCMKQLNVP